MVSPLPSRFLFRSRGSALAPPQNLKEGKAVTRNVTRHQRGGGGSLACSVPTTGGLSPSPSTEAPSRSLFEAGLHVNLGCRGPCDCDKADGADRVQRRVCTARKRNADKTRAENETRTAGHSGGHVGDKNTGQLRKVATASRLPHLLKSHFRVVVRPEGGAGPEPMDQETLHVSDITELLDKLRTDIIAKICPIKLQPTEHATRLQILQSDRQHTLLGTPTPRQ
ncbi:hypothetical protein HPB50_012969 [Hyalomma asiaticum]|uniref:Uncharacterized protein n=1 Tax=Hyalomma asiaticum TaxID=266040 RepID=A0ACB7RV00_HYAAI|nr:hypothetical protein HPB50_012969 [Hyalomma asiaticum]